MTDKTRVELISFIRTNEPKISGVYKKSKAELVDIYLKLTKKEETEEVKEEIKEEVKEEVKEEFDFSKLTKDELIYDINSFLTKQNKTLKGINSKTKNILLQVIKDLKITKHYTKEERNEWNLIREEEIREMYRVEDLKKKLINILMLQKIV